ncbi:MAG: preprotein translocase subunit YajC [Myxococcaceae bacterium]|nr:preprotein translocase subunit YajC [Myxococcaceae bacterium]
MTPAAIPLFAAESAFGGPMAFYLVAMAAIVYFLIIRPQRQQQKEHDNVLTSLKKGDDVVLQSGILGKIAAVTDKTVSLEIASGVKVRVLKSSVQAKVTVVDEAPKADEAAKKEEK